MSTVIQSEKKTDHFQVWMIVTLGEGEDSTQECEEVQRELDSYVGNIVELLEEQLPAICLKTGSTLMPFDGAAKPAWACTDQHFLIKDDEVAKMKVQGHWPHETFIVFCVKPLHEQSIRAAVCALLDDLDLI